MAQPTRDMGRVNVGRVKYTFLANKCCFYFELRITRAFAFVRSGDLYRFCRAHTYFARITVEANGASNKLLYYHVVISISIIIITSSIIMITTIIIITITITINIFLSPL